MPTPALPRPEHPRPQFQRPDWLNLNGDWTFAFDFGRSGAEPGRDWQAAKGFDRHIRVPFCPESRLSGVEHRDFIPCLWYHRRIAIPAAWAGRRVRLHFGAVDYEAEAFVDGQSVGRHFGGTVSFTFDITARVTPGREHDLVVRATDDTRAGVQPGGKQSSSFRSRGCHYTRTTGIWQTVWLEAVHPLGLQDAQILPDLDGGRLVVLPRYLAVADGGTLEVAAASGGRAAGRGSAAAAPGVPVVVPLRRPRPWSPADPHLYDLTLRVKDRRGRVVDEVSSYTGLRKLHAEGNRLFLNNRPLYLRLVLDQGFYPDGIWTAPADEDLRRDIELSLRAGFNGARLHQKVFEERFHYWADRLGYLTWGESSSWGCDPNRIEAARNFLSEWAEILVRDRNHPSIVAWTPWNETRDRHDARQHARVHEDSYSLCRALDPTRPVNDASGYSHVRTDLWTVHTYTQDPAKLWQQLAPPAPGDVWRNYPEQEPAYEGQPYLVDEFGGIKWIPAARQAFADDSWGYGDAPRTEKDFYARLEGQVDALLAYPHIAGFCYTQLTDVEQEQNGIYNYDRSAKFDMTRIAAIFRKKAGRKPAARRGSRARG